MNLKILFMLLLYYFFLSIFFVYGASEGMFNNYNTTINFNDTDIADAENDKGGLFTTGVSFGRFFKFVGFGIGFPSDTPSGIVIFMALWQSLVSIFTVGFVISSIWDG